MGSLMIQQAQGSRVDERKAAEIERHRLRLLDVYHPETRREFLIIDELAAVYQEVEENERYHRVWMEHEFTVAAETFRRQEADDFLRLRRQWPKAPAAITPLIGQSLVGAAFLMEFWRMIVARLEPKALGPVPGMDQACEALLGLGFSCKIHELSEEGWWWATRFLAIQADKDLAIAAWLRKSGTCDRAAETQQARHKLYDAPDANTARKELYDEAIRQASRWAQQLRQLKEAEPALREAQKARARCMGLAIRGLATCLNNTFKIRDSLQKSIKWMEDRLTRARKDGVNDERYYKRMNKLAEQINRSCPEANLPVVPVSAAAWAAEEEFDPGQKVVAQITTELLPRMELAAKIPASVQIAHPPQMHRPMSNRKKRLARMAAKEEKARQLAGQANR